MASYTIDRLTGVFLVILSFGLYLNSESFPQGAEIFPQVLLLTNIVLSVLLVAITFTKSKASGETKGTSVTLQRFIPYITYVMVIIYVSLIRPLGFFTASALFAIGLMYLLGVRRLRMYIYTIIGLSIAIYLLFVGQLHVPLPHGILY